MSYSTTWYHLDKDNKVIDEFIGRPCFSAINNKTEFTNKTQYLLYDFGNMAVTQEQAKQYFLFLKSIPFLKELMPKSCVQMAKDMKYKVDLHKFNGTKIFTILTLIRAVVEDPKIVLAVNRFNRKFKYSVSKFAILKMCGSVYLSNSNHWITMSMDKSNIEKTFASTFWWDDQTPCIMTGLGRHLFETFNFDSYIVKNPIIYKDIDILYSEEHKQPAVKTKDFNMLQLQGL